MAETIRDITPQGLSLSNRKKTIKVIAARWWWLPPFLARTLIGFVFIQAGLHKLYELNHAKDVLNFFWITVPVEHRWDPFFPAVELIFGALLLLGLFTRLTAILLFGILATSLLDPTLKELTGLNLFALQNFSIIALLAGLCVAGAGSASLDRFIFKYDGSKVN